MPLKPRRRARPKPDLDTYRVRAWVLKLKGEAR
jgi:hypothetical protein